jgi:hypothetical protein
MKSLLIFAILGVFALSVHAQTGRAFSDPADSAKYIKAGIWNWPVADLKQTAREQYFKIFDYMNDKSIQFDSTAFMNVLDRFEYWREVVDLKLSTKKDKDDFHNWLADEQKARETAQRIDAKKS